MQEPIIAIRIQHSESRNFYGKSVETVLWIYSWYSLWIILDSEPKRSFQIIKYASRKRRWSANWNIHHVYTYTIYIDKCIQYTRITCQVLSEWYCWNFFLLKFTYTPLLGQLETHMRDFHSAMLDWKYFQNSQQIAPSLPLDFNLYFCFFVKHLFSVDFHIWQWFNRLQQINCLFFFFHRLYS